MFLDFAKTKLRGALKDDKVTDIGLASAMATRILFDFEPSRQKAVNTEGLLVAGFMRVVYSIPHHREYMRTGSPSEPVLAEAAAQIMEEAKEAAVLDLLLEYLDNGLIGRGERGELIARFLLIRAYDRVVKSGTGTQFYQSANTKTATYGRFSVPIPLLAFLQELFPPEHFERIKKCTPQNAKNGVTLEEAFKQARIYFSHFARAGDDSVLTDEFAFSAICSGFAWQCTTNQETIDFLIPIALWDKKLTRYVMSAIVLQIRNRSRTRKVFVDLEKTKKPFFSPPREGASEAEQNRPYIVLVMQLGLDKTRKGVVLTGASPQKQTRQPNAPQHPRYAFVANGCSSAVYRVIGDHENHIYAKMLASRDLFAEHPRKNEFIQAVKEMKPFWKSESFTWVGRYQNGGQNVDADDDDDGGAEGVFLEQDPEDD